MMLAGSLSLEKQNDSKCQEIYPSILINKGYASVKLEKYSQAHGCFNQALEFKIHHANAYYNLAYLHAKQTDFKRAIEKLQEAFTLDSSYQERLKNDQDFREFKDPAFCQFLDQSNIIQK